MELSNIVYHHQDSTTERLYQPLRVAIQSLSVQKIHQMESTRSNSQVFNSYVKKSQNSSSKIQQNKIMESTLFPQNMHLVQTRNPLKRIKVRSKSYRPISVQEKIQYPISDQVFKNNIKNHPPSRKQIIYDYQPNSYQNIIDSPRHFPLSRGQMQMRSRSLPYISPPLAQSLTNRLQKVESTSMAVKRKVSTNKNSQASIKINEQSAKSQPNLFQKQRSRNPQKTDKNEVANVYSDYYQNCNRYNFNKNIKTAKRKTKLNQGIAKQKSPQLRTSSRQNSNYKYNLFSILDEQTNQGCQTGSCTKNQLVASKIRKKW